MAHGFQNKLDSVRDSIASLFKRRKNGGRSKNDGRISTPQNVKRVMHITFDPGNQSFEGIPANWRNYFEGQKGSNPSSAEAAAQEALRVPVEDQYAAVDSAASRKLKHASTPAQHAAPEKDEYAVVKRTSAKNSVEVPPKMAGLVAPHTAEDHKGWGHATEGLASRGHDTQERVPWKCEANSNSRIQSSGPGNLRFEESQEYVIDEEADHLADGRRQNAAGAHPSDGTVVHSAEEHPAHSAFDSTEHSEEHPTHSAFDSTEHSEEHPAHSAFDSTEHSEEHPTHSANDSTEHSEEHPTHSAFDSTEHPEEHPTHSAFDSTEHSEEHPTHSAFDSTEHSEEHPTHSAFDGTGHSEEQPTHAMTQGSTEHSEAHFPHAANNNTEHSEGQTENAADPQAEHPITQEASELALGDLTLTEPASGQRAVLDDHAPLEVEPRRAHLSAFDKTEGASAEAPASTESQQPLRAPRELLSLVYDRDNGRFVNLPPHWEERLVRNNLLEPEFHRNPRLLALVFGMMDQELRSMRAEGERVESCMYSSTLPARSQSRSRENRPYVFRIEADKSNSSSEIDLSSDQQQRDHQRQSAAAQRSESKIEAQLVEGTRQRKLQRGSSFVVIKAVEVPDELDEE